MSHLQNLDIRRCEGGLMLTVGAPYDPPWITRLHYDVATRLVDAMKSDQLFVHPAGADMYFEYAPNYPEQGDGMLMRILDDPENDRFDETNQVRFSLEQMHDVAAMLEQHMPPNLPPL